MIGSPQGLLLYSSKRQKKRHRKLSSNISYLYDNQLFPNLSDHNILSKHQSEFHVLHSTVTALLEACNIDIGNMNAVAFLDSTKAFDTVDHDILLSKLHLYGISGVTNKCFSSYLDNHTQKCLVNGSL